MDTKPTDLPLAEMLRIMDVARTLRQEREIAQEQFNREEARQLLRQRLTSQYGATDAVYAREQSGMFLVEIRIPMVMEASA